MGKAKSVLAVLFFANIMFAANTDPKPQIEITLNQFHEAASKANGKVYFGLFAPEGIFIGTDATERWSVEEFRKYAEPHFSKGKGWTYVPKVRNIDLSPSKDLAWFDEILENKSYGTCRGTGVLRLVKGSWKIAQYHLTIPIPNPLAESVVKQIREASGSKN